MWRYDANRSAASPEQLPAELHLQWRRDLPKPRPAFPLDRRLRFDLSYEPVVLGKTVFVPCMVDDSLTALDTESGAVRWQFFADAPVRLAPAAWDGKVYFVSDDGCLYCLAADDGRLLWRFSGAPSGVEAPKILGNGRLTSRWPARGGPVLRDGVVYFASGVWPFEGTFVYALAAETGKVRWANKDVSFIKDGLIDHGTRRHGGLAPQGHLVVLGDRLIVPSGRSLPGFFDPKTGRQEPYTTGWGGRAGLSKGSWHVAGAGNYLYQSGDLYALTPSVLPPGAPEDPPEELVRVRDFARDVEVSLEIVEGWIRKLPLEVVEREGERFIHVRSHPTLTYLSWWTLPLRPGEEHALKQRPRLQVDPANRKKLGEFQAPVLAGDVVYLSRPVPKGLVVGMSRHPEPEGAEIVACDTTKPRRRVAYQGGWGNPVRVVRWRTVTFEELWRLPSLLRPHIKAGSRLYAGGDGVVAAIDVPAPGGAPKVSWQSKIEGAPHRMLAADGKLFVVSEGGAIHCFGGGKADAARRPTKLKAKPAPAPADEWANRAGEVLKLAGAPRGFCLALGVGSGRLIEELTRGSELYVIAVESDRAKAAGARRRFAAAGIYGTRVHILPGDLSSLRPPPYLASLIVSEAGAAGAEPGRAFAQALFNALRPYGGTACLSLPEKEAATFAQAVAQAKLSGAAVERVGGLTVLRRVGALPGSADWTHKGGTAGNTFASTDGSVKPPFGVLWFGGALDSLTPSYSARPRICGGRMFLWTGHTLHALDIYTGAYLWRQSLPATPGFAKIFAAAEDGVYALAGATCLRLDPATGERVAEIPVPPEVAKGKPKAWRDIRIAQDCLVGTAGAKLVCVDRSGGQLLWSFQGRQGRLSFAAGGGKVFCVEFMAPARLRRGEEAAHPSTVLALDLRTGKTLWEMAVTLPEDTASEERRKQMRPLNAELTYCEASDILLVSAVRSTIAAFQGGSGAQLWSTHVPCTNPPSGFSRLHPPILLPDLLITHAGELYDPRTGARRPNRLWKGVNVNSNSGGTRGCGRALGSPNVVTLRDGHASYFDVASKRRTFFRGIRSGCVSNLIPANGIITAANFAHHCTCNWPVYVSFALAPMAAAAQWTPGQASLRTAIMGETTEMQVMLKNPAPRPVETEVKIGAPPRWQVEPATLKATVPAGAAAPCVFRVTLPRNGKEGWRRVNVATSSPGLSVEPASLEVNALRALGIRPRLTRDLKILVSIRNQRAQVTQGVVSVSAGHGWQVTPAQFPYESLQPGKGLEFAFSLGRGRRPTASPSPGSRLKVTATSGPVACSASLAGPVACPRTDAPPVLNGRLDDPCWAGASEVTGFVAGQTGRPVKVQTAARFACDDGHLYIAMTCRDPDVGAVRAGTTEHDGPVWEDDAVEVYLDSNLDRRTYHQFITNAAGTKYEGIGQDPGWNGAWRVQVAKAQDSWTAEIAIPFKELGVPSPEPKTVWGFNLTRAFRGHEWSQLHCTYGGNHRPGKFGFLVFE